MLGSGSAVGRKNERDKTRERKSENERRKNEREKITERRKREERE